MMLIADSGASKTDWRQAYPDGRVKPIATSGFSPHHQPVSELADLIRNEALPAIRGDITRVFFYGAGLTSKENIRAVSATLQSCFPSASVTAQSDLVAAARALCGDHAGIVAILGTGANCGWYDGKSLYCKVPSLGWILGDEGSGAYLGKQFLKDYLDMKTPPALAARFHDQYPCSPEQLIQRIYSDKNPARFLARISLFIAEHLRKPYCQQLVMSGFEDFYQRNVCIYTNYQSTKVHFVGSIAFRYKRALKRVARSMNITVGAVVKAPIARLTDYHQRHILKL